MTFQLFDMDGNVFEPEKMISYELVSEAEAPCDGLRLSFSCGENIGEISVVKAYKNNKLSFNGFCDKQKITFSASG